jgi:hypothetical protein
MRVTGYQLMDRLEQLQEQAKTADEQFKASLFQFTMEPEGVPDPRVLMETYQRCEEKIARLQEAQAAYNLQVSLDVQGDTMTLQRAVKLIGSLGHIKNQWKMAAKDDNNNFYSNTRQRDKDSVYAERVVSIEACLQLAETVARQATALKQAIRSGNAQEIEVALDPTVFD